MTQAKAAASTLAEEGAKVASEGAEIALQRAEKAKELAASKAHALAEEIKEKGLEKIISDQAIPSDEELLEVGLTEEVFEFVCCLTPETFANFPDQISANDDHFVLTGFQEEHCRLVLRLSPEVVKLRYTLVPLHMTDGRFWSVRLPAFILRVFDGRFGRYVSLAFDLARV
ncbi:hypothetical protein CYMTET_2733 [Cymbomonas tetramitiformis]|uniref:BSD domain-containing protein n=1 Tax=Cymbomonas tetramitiformis TaxID=36881 RepID=A0AAE0LLS4_9CHLO|nr:hypothetical protein CYMTET_2733 [Cymbomonas tetramitiformis]